MNVEEVGDKFSIYANARLYVGGVLILDGKFRLSEINRDGYKGNLGIPAPISVKDLFGDMMLNNAGSWKIDNFKGFNSITEFNTDNYDKELFGDISPCIFPLALYGLLPKTETVDGYTGKDIFDNSVVLGLGDFMPSVNCIAILKKIFDSSGYTLSGTAITDERINKLYMSYKNPNDYEFDWGVSSMNISGGWKHYNIDTGALENKFGLNVDRKQYAVNIFDSRNNEPKIESDTGENINIQGTRTTIIVPRTGLYRVRLHSTLVMLDEEYLSLNRVGVRSGTLNSAPIEVQLVRNLDKTLSEVGFNNKFSRDNIDQGISDTNAIFPQPHRVNFIDPKMDKNFLCGLSFGRSADENYRNPVNPDNCNPMAIKGGRSWDFDDGNGVTDRAYSAVYSPYYLKRDLSESEQFFVDLQNADTLTARDGDSLASGDVRQIVWLEKGERLDLLTTTNFDFTIPSQPYIYGYKINYRLEVEPFNHYIDWLKMDSYGNSTAPMDWNVSGAGEFIENQIDLIKSLPSEMKVNDFIDNFCKAFNLILHNTGGNNFALDIKDKGTVKNTSIIIDLDNKASVERSMNQPLNVPYLYELGFTIDTSEEGYMDSITEYISGEPILSTGETGGGTFYTGSNETNKITQTSSFSYCWYKNLYESEEEKEEENIFMRVPVITDSEIWEHDYDYKEMLDKLYFDKSLRFWYKSGVKDINLGLERSATVALVANEYNGAKEQILDYKYKPNSIMRNFFLLLTNQKYYTVVECYLTPEEYSNLDIALMRFNGDLYNLAEIDGYDPLGRRKCTLKLIRKI